MANANLGEEKKILAPLLGKIYVSPASSESKLRDLYAEVCTAIDDKIISDATGRNALFKIHVSLGKIVNTLGANGTQGRKISKASDVVSSSPVESPVESPLPERSPPPEGEVEEAQE